ncbi:DsbA family protein [Nonomuraea roseoviolacea subsp. roseoviolacea]|uniref:DsbA family protein n=1 Tax=Nonomuraea roseoviolacea TaxID=103837 RepID=UPI0031D20105
MSKSTRQRSARERLAEERRRQAIRDKQRKLIVGVLSGVLVAAVVVVVAVLVVNRSSQSDQKAVAYTGPLAPISRQSDGSILMSKQDVTQPTLEIYEDFQCPMCKRFEERVGDKVKSLAAEGKVRVVYRPFQLFKAPDFQEPVPSVSRRGANAAMCAPADHWPSYAKTLFAYQPEEGKEGFADKELLNWARDLGFYTPAFESCVTGAQKAGDVDKSTQYAAAQNVTGTPTLKVNGQPLSQETVQQIFGDPSSLEQLLTKSATSTASASPSPSASKQ